MGCLLYFADYKMSLSYLDRIKAKHYSLTLIQVDGPGKCISIYLVW